MFEQLQNLINKCGRYAQMMEVGESDEIRVWAGMMYDREMQKINLIKSVI